jgi:hypothetical protein
MNPLSKIAVYQAAKPDDLTEMRDIIGTTVFGLKRSSDDLDNVLVSSVGGCVSFRSNQMWKATNAQNLPTTSAQATQVAIAWLQAAQARVQSGASNSQSGRTAIPDQIIPFNAMPVLSTPMRAPGQNCADHWLTIFSSSISTGIQRTPGETDQSTAPVNSSVELRIGAGNRLLAYYSAWRPYQNSSRQMVQLLDPPADPSNSLLYYDLASSNDPQPVITPYYLITRGDKQGQVHPASSESLSVLLSWIDSDQGAVVKAHTRSRLQGVTYSWGYWRVDDGIFAFSTLDTGSSSQILALTGYGVFNVVVDVSAPSCFGLGVSNICRREITVARLRSSAGSDVA